MSIDIAEGGQQDATENLLMFYDGGIRVGPGEHIQWDHRVVIICHSSLKRFALAVKYGRNRKRIRCPQCRRWAVMYLIKR